MAQKKDDAKVKEYVFIMAGNREGREVYVILELEGISALQYLPTISPFPV